MTDRQITYIQNLKLKHFRLRNTTRYNLNFHADKFETINYFTWQNFCWRQPDNPKTSQMESFSTWQNEWTLDGSKIQNSKFMMNVRCYWIGLESDSINLYNTLQYSLRVIDAMCYIIMLHDVSIPQQHPKPGAKIRAALADTHGYNSHHNAIKKNAKWKKSRSEK